MGISPTHLRVEVSQGNKVSLSAEAYQVHGLCAGSIGVFRTITYLNFAVIEGWTGPSTFWKVQFSNAVIYLLHICIVFHNLSVFVFI